MLNIARGLLISTALVLLCWWSLLGSPSFQTCVQQDQKQSTDNQPENYISAFTSRTNLYRDCLGDFVHDRKDEILVSVTVILAFSTIFLWVATRDLVKGAENTARYQLRAYLGAESISISNVAANEKPLITVRIKNFGETPAYDVYHILESVVAETGNKKFVLDRSARSGKLVLNPLDVFAVRSTKSEALTEEEHSAVLNDTKRVFFFGEIHYRDAFKRPRTTFLSYETSGAALTAEGMLRISQEGNKAT